MTVEDNIPFRETFKNNLLSEFPSMEVIEAANGEGAFKGLASYPIDLVFMDIRLCRCLPHHLLRKADDGQEAGLIATNGTILS